jgi:hypothetical protein
MIGRGTSRNLPGLCFKKLAGAEFSFTHDLLTLFQQVEETGIKTPTGPEAIDGLTAFAVQFRYALYDDEPFDRQAAVQLAIAYIEWAKAIVELSPASKDTADPEMPSQ